MTRRSALFTIAMLLTFMSTCVVHSAAVETVPPLRKEHAPPAKAKAKAKKKRARRGGKTSQSSQNAGALGPAKK